VIYMVQGSQQKLRSDVTAQVDPTDFAVEWSVVLEGAAYSWNTGSWLADSARELGPDRWRATARSPMIGTAPLVLTPGVYALHIRVAGGTEGIPILPVGYLTVRP
jgi:hypothetical protein